MEVNINTIVENYTKEELEFLREKRNEFSNTKEFQNLISTRTKIKELEKKINEKKIVINKEFFSRLQNDMNQFNDKLIIYRKKFKITPKRLYFIDIVETIMGLDETKTLEIKEQKIGCPYCRNTVINDKDGFYYQEPKIFGIGEKHFICDNKSCLDFLVLDHVEKNQIVKKMSNDFEKSMIKLSNSNFISRIYQMKKNFKRIRKNDNL